MPGSVRPGCSGLSLGHRTTEEDPGARVPASYWKDSSQGTGCGGPATAEGSRGCSGQSVCRLDNKIAPGCPWKGLQRRRCPVAMPSELHPGTKAHFLSPWPARRGAGHTQPWGPAGAPSFPSLTRPLCQPLSEAGPGSDGFRDQLPSVRQPVAALALAASTFPGPAFQAGGPGPEPTSMQ